MSRSRFVAFWMGQALLGAALQTPPPPAKQQMPPDEDAPAVQKKPASLPDADLPPDEDAPSASDKVSFNPVKSKQSVATGDYYFHKGNFKAAAERFRLATQWNDGNADAWLRLGQAEEKREQPKAAKAAYEKYLQLAGNTKSAAEVKKRLEKLR